MRGGLRRSAILSVLAGLAAVTAASPSAASVTIGQLDPGTPGPICATTPFDRAQPTVTSGNSYVVPSLPPASDLAITSWSTKARSGPDQMMTIKVFRKIGNPNTYKVVGHDGPHSLATGMNTFPSNLPVQPGDVLGLNPVGSTTLTGCLFNVPGDQFLNRNGNLADNESGAFAPSADYRLNITAVVSPSNAFTVGRTTLNKKKGTASLSLNVPNPGELTASGKGVKASGATTSKAVTAPGTTKLKITAKGKQKRTLDKTGKVKLSVTITYTPTGGDLKTQSLKVKLKKKI
jgi:hypothetical protein